MKTKIICLICAIMALCPTFVYGQTTNLQPVNYDFNWKQLILPATLITIGSVAVDNNAPHRGSVEISNTIRGWRDGRPCHIDDYMQYMPIVGTLSLDFLGAEAKHSLRDRALITATSCVSVALLVNVTKSNVVEKRPEGTDLRSFPSGHTATAFMGAELVRIEYGGWYGVGAYAIASTVGFMRVYNGAHWLHDVVAGAGIGILSARIGEWTGHLWQKWFPQNNAMITPTMVAVTPDNYGVALCWQMDF